MGIMERFSMVVLRTTSHLFNPISVRSIGGWRLVSVDGSCRKIRPNLESRFCRGIVLAVPVLFSEELFGGFILLLLFLTAFMLAFPFCGERILAATFIVLKVAAFGGFHRLFLVVVKRWSLVYAVFGPETFLFFF